MGPVSATLLDGTVITAATFDELTEAIDAHVTEHGPTDPVAPAIEVVEPPSPDITGAARAEDP